MVALGLIVMLVYSSPSFVDHFPFLDAYAETTMINVKTDKAYYKIGDVVEITGSVKNPSSDILILKIFNSDTNIVLKSQLILDEKDSFHTSVLLYDPTLEDSKFYVVTVKMNDVIATASFELIPSEEKQTIGTKSKDVKSNEKQMVLPENINQLLQKLVDSFYQNIVFVFIIVIIVASIIIWVAYPKKLPSIKNIKHKSKPLITFENPAPAQIHLSDGTKISYESWKSIPIDQRHGVATIEFWIPIKNIGEDVATNIFSAFIKQDNIFSRQDLMGKEMNPIPDLSPGEFYYQNFEISWDRFVKLKENDLFVGLSISYAKQQTKSYSGKIFGIGMGGNYIIDGWFT